MPIRPPARELRHLISRDPDAIAAADLPPLVAGFSSRLKLAPKAAVRRHPQPLTFASSADDGVPRRTGGHVPPLLPRLCLTAAARVSIYEVAGLTADQEATGAGSVAGPMSDFGPMILRALHGALRVIAGDDAGETFTPAPLRANMAPWCRCASPRHRHGLNGPRRMPLARRRHRRPLQLTSGRTRRRWGETRRSWPMRPPRRRWLRVTRRLRGPRPLAPRQQ